MDQPLLNVENLPVPVPPRLVGRDQHLHQLRTLLATVGAVWLHGVPGSGRRALAAKIAAEYVERPGGVLWFSVYHDDLIMLTNRIARAYGVAALANDDITTQLEMVQALLQQNAPLIVIEGPIASGVIYQFLKQSAPPRLPLIIVSSEAAEGPWRRLELGPLLYNDAEQLYRIAGKLEDTRRTALLAPLLDYIEGHPLALVVAGYQNAGAGSNSTHLASLVPKAPSGPENRALGIYAAAHALLDSPSQGLFLLLGALFVDRIGLALLSVISGVPESTLQPLLDRLIARGLCDKIPGSRTQSLYRVHDLARIYARRRLSVAKQLEQTRTRILKGILRFLEKNTETTSEQSFDSLALEMDHVLGAARYASSLKDTDTLQSIFKLLGRHGTQNVVHSRGFHPLYDRLGRLLTGKPLQTEQVFHAQIAASRPAEAPATNTEKKRETNTLIRIDTQQFNTMSYETLEIALEAAQARKDVAAETQLRTALGNWYFKHQKYDQALPHFEQSAHNFALSQDNENLVAVLEKLGLTFMKLNRPPEALENLKQGLVIARKLGDVQREGLLTSVSGDVYLGMNDLDKALESYLKATVLLQKEEDVVNTGLALGKLANIYMDRGNFQEATVVLAQTVSLFEQAGRRDLQGQALGNLGTAFGRLGRWREAGQRHMLALQIARETEDIEEERFQLSNLAYVAEAEGHLEWAIYYGRQALYLSLISGDKVMMARLTLDLGRLLLLDPNQLPQSIALLEASADLALEDEAVRLLSRARKRLERLQETGYRFLPAETNLQTYAQAAYEMSN